MTRRTFANVTRHNGFEAWRRLAEPINNDKALLRKELLAGVTNPWHASNVDDVEKALREWDTNKRLLIEAGGSLSAAPSSCRAWCARTAPLVATVAGLPTCSGRTGLWISKPR